MALSVKQLNADASFLLTFEPIVPESTPGAPAPRPFRILMDPWITGPSTIFHSVLSTAMHKESPCVCSLQSLPEPDLVIVSQHKSDHCNEATLRQLPASGTRTLILAEPTAAKVIRGWRYFDSHKVHAIPRWEEPSSQGAAAAAAAAAEKKEKKETVIRVKVPPFTPGGECGEVSVAFIPQRRDFKGLHAAIGITYRPPPTWPKFTHLITPPVTPVEQAQQQQQQQRSSGRDGTAAERANIAEPTPPDTPSARTLSCLPSGNSARPAPADFRTKAVSVIFSPHGISYRCLEKYARSHLVAESALPLTALLHCFDTVSNPWWFGGNISAGMPAGQETAAALGARAWVSTHDGCKNVKGLATKLLRTKRYGRQEVAERLSPPAKGSSRARGNRFERGKKSEGRMAKSTEVLVLGVGEEVAMTREGVWNVELDARVLAPPGGGEKKRVTGKERGRTLKPIVTARK
ncbi:hypothetical protein C8034_v001970 [Colletotrichum sidae]|uniref:N-acyl-phosphatidylethanolamine-hydrolyzing phospholipase D n=1 Tax=Colletotrichum sidae TaxID=1347389 RepID=A0A4R8PER1_9PEZI|nr:hypothetical protein C8034_v001970 [Colletotrichum sidae]